MDATRFDAISRTLAGRLSRRLALRTISLGALSSLLTPGGRDTLAQTPSPTPLPVCTDPARPGVGCPCMTGIYRPCGDTTLICRMNDPNGLPGSQGTCIPSSVDGSPAGPPAACSGHGCRCDGGVENACDDGLICCPDHPDLPGGPGRCVPEAQCNQTDCRSHGCICHSGTRDACDQGLICCAHDASQPGGSGRCDEERICFQHQCQSTTNPCPSTCVASAFCPECCSGYCGPQGHCATPDGSGEGADAEATPA